MLEPLLCPASRHRGRLAGRHWAGGDGGQDCNCGYGLRWQGRQRLGRLGSCFGHGGPTQQIAQAQTLLGPAALPQNGEIVFGGVQAVRRGDT